MAQKFDEQALLDLKTDIDSAKTTVAELTGQRQALLKQLKDDWDCSSIDQAEKKMEKIKKEIAAIDAQIKQGTADLEKEFNKEE